MFLTLYTKYFEEYADGTTPRVVRDDTKYITSALVKTFDLVFQKCNETKCDKCHILLNTQGNNVLKMGNFSTKKSLSGKLLDINFDYNLKFNIHTEDICQKTSCTLNTLARLTPYMGLSKCRLLTHVFFKSHFNCFPLVWMYCNQFLNDKINHL